VRMATPPPPKATTERTNQPKLSLESLKLDMPGLTGGASFWVDLTSAAEVVIPEDPREIICSVVSMVLCERRSNGRVFVVVTPTVLTILADDVSVFREGLEIILRDFKRR